MKSITTKKTSVTVASGGVTTIEVHAHDGTLAYTLEVQANPTRSGRVTVKPLAGKRAAAAGNVVYIGDA